MSRLPIRVRVTAAFALAMALVLAGSGFYLYSRLGSHLSLALDRELRLRAQDLRALVASGGSLQRAGGGRLVEQGESYAELLDARGRVLEATRPLRHAALLDPSELRAAAHGPIYAHKVSVPGLDEPSRLLATSVPDSRVLIVGATLQDRAETLASFRDELLVAGPIALLLASLAGYFLAGLSLRQVEGMRRRAASISAEKVDERLPVPPTGDELQRLGETLNEMLERLEAALERERGFVADAGHELRTPLSVLRTELELALRQAGSEDELREAVRRAAQETERLSQLAEDLLLIARSDRGRLPLRVEEVAVDELFESVIRRFEWRARPIHAEPAPNVAVRGDRLRLEQALGNLVDNALRYGGDSIELAAVAENGRVELHVRDDGPGFPSDLHSRAFERFARADPARGRSGAGLGLSIAMAIAEAHGGTAHAENVRSTGADVWLELPIDVI